VQVSIDANPHTIAGVWGGETHNHPRFEVHIMLNGSCRMDMDGTSYVLRQRQMVVVAPGRYHRQEAGNRDFERVSLSVGPGTGLLSRAMQEAVEKQTVYPITEEMVNLCRGILMEGEKNRPYRKEMMQVQVSELTIAVLRELNLGEEDRGMDKEGRRIPSAIDMYFERNLALNPGAEDLAQQLHLSRRQVNRVLQANYGMGFREKLLQARLERAKWLLRRTEKSVSVIAGEVGYTYDSAFREAFYRQVGMTPQAYRLNHKKINVQEEAGK
jgi:AraC-like DNA-binding protein